MIKYKCPDCGRHLLESDAPPGYTIRVPVCRGCRTGKVLRTSSEATATGTLGRPRRPDPLRYR